MKRTHTHTHECMQAKHMFFDHRVGYAAKERRHLLETLLGTSETVWEGMLHYRMAAGQAVTVGLEAFPAIRDDKVRMGGRQVLL